MRWVCIEIYVDTDTDMCAYIQICVHTYIHIYVHAYIHTYIPADHEKVLGQLRRRHQVDAMGLAQSLGFSFDGALHPT